MPETKISLRQIKGLKSSQPNLEVTLKNLELEINKLKVEIAILKKSKN